MHAPHPYRSTVLAIPAIVILLLGASAPASAQAPAAPMRDWTGTAGIGLSVTSGNSDTTNFNIAFDVKYDRKTKNLLKFTGLYLRGDKDDELTVDRTGLGFRDEYSITPRFFVFGQLDYLRDSFKLIDYLLAPTGGVGYRVIDTMRTQFEVDGGAGGVWEKNPGIVVRKSGALTAGEKLTHQLTATATVKEGVTALWKTDDFSDSLYNFSAGIGVKVTEIFQISVDLLDTYKNLPPTPETKKNDVALVTAFAAKF
jgi:putative salt-induced outer membrane protein YdiY